MDFYICDFLLIRTMVFFSKWFFNFFKKAYIEVVKDFYGNLNGRIKTVLSMQEKFYTNKLCTYKFDFKGTQF